MADARSIPGKKNVVILGGFGHEGITSQIESLGFNEWSRSLNKVSAKTWLKRASEMEDMHLNGRLAATIIRLHSSLLLKASSSKYRDAFLAILKAAQGSKLIVFIFQDNLSGIFVKRRKDTGEPYTLNDLEEWHRNAPGNAIHEMAVESLRDYLSRPQEVHAFIQFLYDSGAQIAPFYRRSDVTIRIQEFLSDLGENIYLRLFIPNDRLQAEQLASLLEVLERYLRQIEGQTFSVDSHKSEKGTVYLFKSEGGLTGLDDLNDAFRRFNDFMQLCEDDPRRAESLLITRGIAGGEASFLVQKYSRDYRRLLVDMRHEFERKSLSLRQKLEADMVEGGSGASFSSTNESLGGILQFAAPGTNVTINIGKVSVASSNRIRNEIDQLITGSAISYNESDRELLKLIASSTNRLEALQSQSDLDQLKDVSVPDPTRRNARQRLISFLSRVAQRGGEVAQSVATEALKHYVDSLISGT